MGLHNALDGAPYYFLGGHASPVAASPHHAMALASLSSWMSVAEQAGNKSKKNSAEVMEELMEQVNTHLETRTFLVDSPSMTIADIDLAVVMTKAPAALDNVASYPHVHRWLITIQDCMQHEYGIELSAKKPVPPISSATKNAAAQGPQLFFYGNETNVEIPKASAPAPKAQQGKEGAKGKKDQTQQEQPSKKDAKAGKQPKQKQQQQQQQSAAPTAFDVSALDIRVGQITKVWHHPESEKLFCEEIDVGEDQPRQIASGLRHFYQTADLENRRVVVLCNLKKRNLVGFPSHGMVLCASNADHTSVECMEPPADAKIGERVTFEGFEGDPEPENKIAKKKIFEAVAPDLKTNAQGICVWKGATSKTSSGPIKASKGMPDAQVS